MRALVIFLLWIVMLAGLMSGPIAGVGHAAVAPIPACNGVNCGQAQLSGAKVPCPDAEGRAAKAALLCDLSSCLAQTLVIGASCTVLVAARPGALSIRRPNAGHAHPSYRADGPDRPPTA